MANANSTAATFTATGNVYQIPTDTSRNDMRDQLNAKISQASAMLNMLVSDGGLEHFRCMSDEAQADYLWAISMATDEAKDLIKHL